MARATAGPIAERCLSAVVIEELGTLEGMSHAKQASKPKSRTKAVTVVAIAGALSLAAGASVTAVGPVGHAPMANTAV